MINHKEAFLSFEAEFCGHHHLTSAENCRKATNTSSRNYLERYAQTGDVWNVILWRKLAQCPGCRGKCYSHRALSVAAALTAWVDKHSFSFSPGKQASNQPNK